MKMHERVHEPHRKLLLVGVLVVGVITVMMTMHFELEGSEVGVTHAQGVQEVQSNGRAVSSEDVVAGVDRVPPRLLKVIGEKHAGRLKLSDELLQAVGQPLGFLSNVSKPFGDPTLSPDKLREALDTEGFAMIPNMLRRGVAKELRRYLLSLLNEEGVNWVPNEGEDARTGTLGRVMHGLPKKYYAPLEEIMSDANMIRYMSALLPCKQMDPSKKFRMTQMFITINDRIRWHVDYPNQPPLVDGKTTMYGEDFCQIKTIYYLQDHNEEGPGNPSALMVVPRTHKAEPKWYKCGGKNCSIARKQMVPSAEYTSVNIKPALGDLAVMDARLLHAAADYTLTLPTVPQPTPRLHKYRVFLQFLWGVTDNKLTDAMQRKKDKNLVTKHFKKNLFP
eukprot:TRINITY_DN2018_c0_g1_i2.p1 TRINITY_DN2018_c0_g1~~TRINITY_DN2018_c0_g1_i2.p1  ORF type:complete len:391 (+),score=131.15 TRINITY_DN2018_c0_g1_i2:1488-2660(+)